MSAWVRVRYAWADEGRVVTADKSERPDRERTARTTSTEVAHLIGTLLPDIAVPATTAPQGLSLRYV